MYRCITHIPAGCIPMAFISACPVPAPNSAPQRHLPPQSILKERAGLTFCFSSPHTLSPWRKGTPKNVLDNLKPVPSRRLRVWWERRHESEFNSRENQKERRPEAVLSVGTASLLVPKWALWFGEVGGLPLNPSKEHSGCWVCYLDGRKGLMEASESTSKQ